MVHDFSGRSSGKFPGARERLKRQSCFSGRNDRTTFLDFGFWTLLGAKRLRQIVCHPVVLFYLFCFDFVLLLSFYMSCLKILIHHLCLYFLLFRPLTRATFDAIFVALSNATFVARVN